MLKSLSINLKLLFIVIGSIIFVSVILLIQSISSLNKTSEIVINDFKKDAYLNKEKELKNYVSLTMKTIDYYYKRSSKEKVKTEVSSYLKEQNKFLMSIINAQYEKYKHIMKEDELKELLKHTIRTSRYGKSGYFWVNDFNAKIIVHGVKHSLEGKNLSSFKDKKGKRLFYEAAKIGRNKGSGFISYYWSKPGSSGIIEKISYLNVFKAYNWVIGNGKYIDDVSSSLKKDALLAISNMKYGKSGYFWINDSNHVVLMHGAKKSLVGKNLSNLQDPNGKYIYREIVKVANQKSEGSILNYIWNKPGFDEPVEKLAFVQKFKEWDLIVGTGAYVDDIESRITQMKDKTQEQINNTIINTIIIILIVIIVLSLLMSYVSNKVISKPLEEFQEGLLNFFKYLNKESKDVKRLENDSNDEIGIMSKLINKNLLKTQSLLRQDEELINDVKRVVEEVKKGHLNFRVEKSTQNEALQELKTIFNEMLINIENNVDSDINKITDALDSFTNLDFTHTIDNANGKVSIGLNDLAKIINKLLLDNLTNGSSLEDNASMLSNNVNQLSKSSNAQAASLEETAAALEEITSTIISTTENISNMATYSKELKDLISAGQELAVSTVNSMNDINSQTQAIAEAITVIDQIAFQTNILSLNAAVEAATAGEAGKGFAVVAQEVRNLASRSADAAKEIKDLVEKATVKTNFGKKSADKMIAGYDELNVSILKTTKTINDISTASKEQQEGIEQINDAITTLDQGTQGNASVASQTANIAESTSIMAKAIVDEANEANFIGKTNFRRNTIQKEMPNNHSIKRISPKKVLVKKDIIANNNNIDAWESF